MDSSSFYCFIVSKPTVGKDLVCPNYNKKGIMCIHNRECSEYQEKNEIDKLVFVEVE